MSGSRNAALQDGGVIQARREAEYNDWYQNVHLGQVVALKGFKSAQRLRLTRNLVEGEAHPYLAIYEMETDDLDGVMQSLMGAVGTEQMILSEALDTAHAYAAIYEEFGPAVEK